MPKLTTKDALMQHLENTGNKYFSVKSTDQNARLLVIPTHTQKSFYLIDILSVSKAKIETIFHFTDPQGWIVDSTEADFKDAKSMIQSIESDIRNSFGIH
jgi:hypothetical protein